MDFKGEGDSCYYRILGIDRNSSISDIRRAYRKLAMKWHPDKWARMPWLLEEAKRRFQLIQEAYHVLSDQNKRRMYDLGLYCDEEEEGEDFSDFLNEMTVLIENVKMEGKIYSWVELQEMFEDMARGFGNCDTTNLESSGSSWRQQTNLESSRSSWRQQYTGSNIHNIPFGGIPQVSSHGIL